MAARRSRLGGALLFVLVAGCGGNGGGDDGSPGGTATAPAPTPTVSAGRAFAVGLSGILRSDDGGRTWSALSEPGYGLVIGVHFVDRMTGWAVSDAGGIFHTTDGGQTFSNQGQNIVGVERPAFLRDVVFLDAQRGFIVGGEGPVRVPDFTGPPFVLVTADAGAHWTPAAIPRGPNPALAKAVLGSVCFTTTGIGLASGGSILLLSEDGGANWQDITDRLPAAAPGAAGKAVCVGEADLWRGLIHSSDGGRTWVDQSAGAPPDEQRSLGVAAFVDSLTGWAAGHTAPDAPPPILHTTDGGRNWVAQALPAGTLGGLSAVAFLDRVRGVTVGGYQGAIGFTTQDGGESWVASSFPQGAEPLLDLSLVP